MKKIFKKVLLSVCLLSVMTNAHSGVQYNKKTRGDKQKARMEKTIKKQAVGKSKGLNYGQIAGPESRLDLRDLKKFHGKEMKDLKEKHKLRGVKIVVCTDDYWYYALEGQDHLHGVADTNGNIIIPPIYNTLYYCPSVNEGVDEFPVNDRTTDKTQTFRVFHPYTKGAFVCDNTEQSEVIGLDGELKRIIPSPYTYYHGYLIGGVSDESLFYLSDNNAPLSLMAFANNASNGVSFITSDGQEVGLPNQIGIRMESFENGEQPAISYHYDKDRTLRQGAFMVNEPSAFVPDIFGGITYQRDSRTWMVNPNALENAQPYNPLIHTTTSYIDEGEKMFYQGDYQGCLNFYNSLLNDDGMEHKAFYTAMAYFQQSTGRFATFNRATAAFENLSSGDYENFYDQRKNMQQWPKTDIPNLKESLRWLDKYDEASGSRQFSKASEEVRTKIINDIAIYEDCQQRYDNALATLDNRIRSKKEAEARQAAADEAAANAFASILIGGLSSALSGIAGGGSNSSGSSAKQIGSSSVASKSSGSKTSSSSGNSSSGGVREKKEPCKTCGGSGTCQICKGSGKSSKKLGMSASCDACHGNKKCSICDGKGYKLRYESYK